MGRGANKIARVMREFHAGKLRSSSGHRITSKRQAVAVALSEARRAGQSVTPKRRKWRG